ncbi:MAG TPA: hypothetical protein VD978_37210 [Azospirillum sp.]|nr:hypothetical protein [Azospirillum sp.]
MTSTPLPKPARSVLDDAPDNLKAFVGSLADKVAQGANWMVRKKTLCDYMLSLGAYLALSPAERQELASAGGHELPPEDGNEGDVPARFGELLPFYVGAILETLGEERIASAEQAAVYVLSIHPEHQAAAEAWMMADPRNAKAVRKVVRGDKRFAALLKTARVPGARSTALMEEGRLS